jgi:23S rRNA (cytosine1962-C5)-methyltransferase
VPSSDWPERLLRLRADRGYAVRKGHPWVFSGAVRSDTGVDDAAIARVESDRGEFLGLGFYSRESQIRARLLEGETVWRGEEFFTDRVVAAQRLRRCVIGPDTTGYRLINAEGDGVPGWTVDRFGDVLVSQITSAGLEKVREAAYAALAGLLPECSVLQSNDLPSRRLEGLGLEDREVAGRPPSVARFAEHGLLLEADLAGGQKTGYYCDQRENRLLAARVAQGARVLDLFTHSGGFALHAARGGAARVVAVDSSQAALDRLDVHARLNRLSAIEARRADVFEFLRQAEGEFDIVICDPPPLARRRADVERAARAYKDVSRLAMKRLAPGGQLFTFTCSGAVDATLFRQILVAAAHEAGIALSWLKPLAAGPDHPIAAGHPEGEYLKGWWCVRR